MSRAAENTDAAANEGTTACTTSAIDNATDYCTTDCAGHTTANGIATRIACTAVSHIARIIIAIPRSVRCIGCTANRNHNNAQ